MLKKKFFIMAVLMIFCLTITVFTEGSSAFSLEQENRVLREGDEGGDVALLQRKLKDKSYYKGEIDGLFGSKTEEAVKRFQEDNNLKGDGIVGPNTYRHLPKDELPSRINTSREEVNLLARAIHGEARGEPFKGKVAVGAVILNRVEHKEFPDSIREVIVQEGQFSSLLDGQANLYPDQSSVEAAKEALVGYDPTYGSIFFYNPEIATNLAWISRRPIIVRIGNHVFAK